MQEKKAIVTHIMADWLRLEVPVAAIPGTYPKNLLSEGASLQQGGTPQALSLASIKPISAPGSPSYL